MKHTSILAYYRTTKLSRLKKNFWVLIHTRCSTELMVGALVYQIFTLKKDCKLKSPLFQMGDDRWWLVPGGESSAVTAAADRKACPWRGVFTVGGGCYSEGWPLWRALPVGSSLLASPVHFPLVEQNLFYIFWTAAAPAAWEVSGILTEMSYWT